MRVFSIFLLFFLVSILSLTSFFLKMLKESYSMRVSKKLLQDAEQLGDILFENNDNKKEEEPSKCQLLLAKNIEKSTTKASTTNVLTLLQQALRRQARRVRGWHNRRTVEKHNRYNLDLAKPKNKECWPQVEKKAKTLVCQLNQTIANDPTFLRDNTFFGELELAHLLPQKTLFSNEIFDTCAVVSSAGSLLNSNLGRFIDDHDVVIRFNNAPTKDFSGDVGVKTSLRIVNSKVVADPRFDFLASSLFPSASLLVWDPSGYNESFSDWYEHPDQPFFETFFSLSLMQSRSRLHLLKPSVMWELWHFLQAQLPTCPLLPNPPSSGFLGLAVALRHCKRVRLVYFITQSISGKCHYYEEDINNACTTGEWHPIAAEKLIAFAMSNQDSQLLHKGIVEISGLPDLNCDN